uniref:Glycosyl hydrolase family 13 catalytic domain-containing protein n=1 Tax=Haptolina brevifila TaxID=156173 RepID=A0A7S2DX77_9EUKA|mmetsp:Transcript_45224/g.90313  ORF Transcript_45224/g.90313 Transcript_45224/m.90313 type:complete len:379 (+) Transcript_45224:230-1366(+)
MQTRYRRSWTEEGTCVTWSRGRDMSHVPRSKPVDTEDTIILDGWFGDLADLKQEDEAVRRYLLTWIRTMVTKYKIDGLRLDTALYMPTYFLSEFQQASQRLILGEVPTLNVTLHRSFTPPLSGLLNFPATTLVSKVFSTSGSLSDLAAQLARQHIASYPAEGHRLANFIDNHDMPRFLYSHSGDETLLQNSLTWAFLWHGLPVMYYGTENPAVSNQRDSRMAMWPSGFAPTSISRFVASLNELRQHYAIGAGGAAVKSLAVVAAAAQSSLAFTRASLLVVVGNRGHGQPLEACIKMSALPPTWQHICASGAGGAAALTHVLGTSTDRAVCMLSLNEVQQLPEMMHLCVRSQEGGPIVYAQCGSPLPCKAAAAAFETDR